MTWISCSIAELKSIFESKIIETKSSKDVPALPWKTSDPPIEEVKDVIFVPPKKSSRSKSRSKSGSNRQGLSRHHSHSQALHTESSSRTATYSEPPYTESSSRTSIYSEPPYTESSSRTSIYSEPPYTESSSRTSIYSEPPYTESSSSRSSHWNPPSQQYEVPESRYQNPQLYSSNAIFAPQHPAHGLQHDVYSSAPNYRSEEEPHDNSINCHIM